MENKKEESNVNKYEDNNKCKKDDEGCFRVIRKDVGLVANVKLMPIICINEKDIDSECVGQIHLSDCKKYHIKKECDFCIKQDVTLRIPVRFDTKTEVEDIGIVCHSEDHCYEDCDDEK